MASKVTGSSLAYRYRVESEYDPQTGNLSVEYWKGPKLAIKMLEDTYRNMGIRVKGTYPPGPLAELTARIGTSDGLPNNPGSEVPHDQWDIDVEIYQVPIWSDHVIADAMAEAATFGAEAAFRKAILDAVKDGTALPEGLAGSTVAQTIYDCLVQGDESVDRKRVVLSRIRTFSTQYAQRMVINAAETVYTRAALISTFGVPAAVQAQLPQSPSDTPKGKRWGWKMRTDHSTTIPALGKIQETRDWVLAPWTEFNHDFIG